MFKHVLYTRLHAVASQDVRGEHDGFAKTRAAAHKERSVYPVHRPMGLGPGWQEPHFSPRLSVDDPFPPEDRIVMGSIVTLETLYKTQGPRLRGFFARRTDRQDVADLVQESFARLADAAADPDKAIANPEAYLQAIASNVLRNRAKSALQRSLARQVPIEETNLTAPDAVATLEARDLLNRLQTALKQLSPKTRHIFLAHRIDGLSYKALAEQQGLSVKGVEWHMHKAIGHLDKAFRSR